jgi:hypothetical protein
MSSAPSSHTNHTKNHVTARYLAAEARFADALRVQLVDLWSLDLPPAEAQQIADWVFDRLGQLPETLRD